MLDLSRRVRYNCSMTTRDRLIITYSAKLSVAIRRHLELNPGMTIAEITPKFVKNRLYDCMGGTNSPYLAELSAYEEKGSRAWTRLVREIVRKVEDSLSIRRDHWAKGI